MSFTAQAPSSVSGYVYAGSTVLGMLLENSDKGVATTNEDMGYDGAGKMCLYGNQCDEAIRGQCTGIVAGTTGIMAATVGARLTTAMIALAVAGYPATTGTLIVLNLKISKDDSGGKFARISFDWIFLPFTAA